MNGTLLFTGDDEVAQAANRRDVLSIQIDNATNEPATWSVVVTGRAELATGVDAPAPLQAALDQGATLLALSMTLLFGRREI